MTSYLYLTAYLGLSRHGLACGGKMKGRIYMLIGWEPTPKNFPWVKDDWNSRL